MSVKTINIMIDVLSLGQDCSDVYGSLLLPPYYNLESQFNMTDLFQNFNYQIDTCTLWEPLSTEYPDI